MFEGNYVHGRTMIMSRNEHHFRDAIFIFLACTGADTPCPVHAGIHPPPPAATAMDGTHPTGVHSFYIDLCALAFKVNRHPKGKLINMIKV